jgi:hypothetical protein
MELLIFVTSPGATIVLHYRKEAWRRLDRIARSPIWHRRRQGNHDQDSVG